MQSNPEKHTVRRLQVPAAGNLSFRSNSMASLSPRPHHICTRSSSPRPQHMCTRSSSPRPQHMCTRSSSPRPQRMCTRSSSCNSRPIRGVCHEIPIPGNRLRRHRADKEILRRALTPPVRRQSRRWWNFRPMPSRLCNMSKT
ncbi:uncharacterized protein LOC131329251 [Rhododendron vialii]|uniref:uncharacterized protein LOC131329251 n=1 Tax=Rhododendron vialii TaxID=182163 RepID=UPI00265E8CB4|nr:uncharacterized protein LOC131329251 [Rhododendron vialii]